MAMTWELIFGSTLFLIVSANLREARRAEMVELIVEYDEFLLEKYLMEEPVTDDELRSALRAATIAGKIQPVMCGSSLKNKGVQLLLDAVVDILPSPLDIPPVSGLHPDNEEVTIERRADDSEPVAALVFTIITDPYVGRLAFILPIVALGLTIVACGGGGGSGGGSRSALEESRL